ncbi:MAG: DUF4304 domain-containing protein [Gemmatimonadetes bacterium]|nr:DUF4304 domain-containing protein [Gemmatimonadota bacterium]
MLSPALKAAGFGKAGATWRRTNAPAVGVFNLRGSQWGPSFVNLGVYRALVTASGRAEPPAHPHPPPAVTHGRTGSAKLLLDFETDAAECRGAGAGDSCD